MDNIIAGILALLAFIVGGGISKALDQWPVWGNWHPYLFGSPAPFIKSAAAFLIVAVLILALVTVYQLLPQYWDTLPKDVQAIIVLFAAALGAFIRNETSTTAKLRAEMTGK